MLIFYVDVMTVFHGHISSLIPRNKIRQLIEDSV